MIISPLLITSSLNIIKVGHTLTVGRAALSPSWIHPVEVTHVTDATFSDDLDVFTGQGEPANIKPPQRNLGHSPVQPCVLTLTDGTFGSVDVSRRKSLVYLVIYYLSHIVCSSLVGWNLVGR